MGLPLSWPRIRPGALGWGCLFFGCLASGLIRAHPDGIGPGGVWQAGATVADPDGALALGSNPAGLIGPAGIDGRFLWSSGGRGGGLGGFVDVPWGPIALGLGGAWSGADSLRPGADAHWQGSLGLGWRLGDTLALGGQWQTHGGTTSGDTWGAGGLWRPASWLSVGARLVHLDATRPGADDWTAAGGIGLRWPGSSRFTVSGEVEGGGSSPSWRHVRLAARWQVASGLQLVGDWQRLRLPAGQPDEQRAGLLVRLGFGRLGLGAGVKVGTSPGGDWQPELAGELRLSQDALPALSELESGAVRLRLEGELRERRDASDALTLTEIAWQLQRLRDAPAVHLIVFDVKQLAVDWAQVEELRALFAQLRKAGKTLVWSAEDLGVRNLMLAAACDRVVMPASGTVSARGLSGDFLGLREALARLGVAVEVVRFRDHKTAPEPLTRDAPSTELQAQLEAQLKHHWQAFGEAVALGRQISPTALESLLAAGVVFPADARAAGLIDAVIEPDGLDAQLRAWRLLAEDEVVASWRPLARRRQAWGPQRRVAVVTLDGGISDHGGLGLEGATVGGVELGKLVREVGSDPVVDGVVMRIRSPGGTLLGSDAMRHALTEVARHKPVVASMGGVAASGGYWTALGAPTILADRATLTGSIGAFVLKPSLAGLLDHLHVHRQGYDLGPHAGITSLWRPWTATEAAAAERSLGRFYGLFLDRTAEARKLTVAQVDALAGGRIWFGDEARRRGLVDRQGGVLDAIALVEAAVGRHDDDDRRIDVLPRPSLRQRVLHLLGLPFAAAPSPAVHLLQEAMGPWLDPTALTELVGHGGPWVLLPVHGAGSGR
jgi:protease-4